MGTHISKIKSIDLDVWTPEQMEVGSSHTKGPSRALNLASFLVDREMGQSSCQFVLGGPSETGAYATRTVSARSLCLV